MAEILELSGKSFFAYSIPTPKTSILIIAGARGVLGCGYLSVDAAKKFDDSLAIVRGVKNFDDMLAATVAETTPAAMALGVTVGMSGREALLKLA